MKTAEGLEPRIVRLGISDFDYAQVLSGLEVGDEVVLLNAAELQAKRDREQSMIRARIGSTMPGGTSGTAGSARTPAGGR